MSIPILHQVYDEMRRLAIAGSVVAGGDFRLKKMVPTLEAAGAKAPVFARVAEAVKAVVGAQESTAAAALLDLTTLVHAILYTQGETGAPGPLVPIETANFDLPTTQTSAQVLKPLREALTHTGGGRLELIRDAHVRGAFRDIRLVQPALAAIDDTYGEIGDFVAEQVLPTYGPALLPELRGQLDLKGRGGHARRLRLMHTLDPEGMRATVKQALESGSKEVKVAAIECLGGAPDDLPYLLEQAGAKAREVRQAAYGALAALEDDAAVAALQKALTGDDLGLVAASPRRGRSARVIHLIVATADAELAGLAKTKDKKEISLKISRLELLLACLSEREHPEGEALIRKLFDQRDTLVRIKGATRSGADLNAAVVGRMTHGTPELQHALAAAHATLPPEILGLCFEAARRVLPAATVFEMFAPYLLAKADDKKKQRDPAWARRTALEAALGGQNYYWVQQSEDAPPLDPRWLDAAVAVKNLGLVRQLARPGHAGANAFLKETFDTRLQAAQSFPDCHEALSCMVWARHPEATEAFVATIEVFGKQPAHLYGFAHLIPQLPASAVPRLEALLPSLPEKVADQLLGPIQALRGSA